VGTDGTMGCCLGSNVPGFDRAGLFLFFIMYFKFFYNKSAILLITDNNFDTARCTDFLAMKSG
jgi:hypothetical protein